MPTGIIEINDADLRVGMNGSITAGSPGYAVLDGGRLLVGEDGLRNARLLPRWTNNRFWNQLGTEPVPNGTETVRHHADLAFAHLERLWKDIANDVDKVIMAVPGFYTREQLSLLLGMARECNIPVSGLVDTSLVTVSGSPAHPTILHLDIFLHRITLTILRSDTLLRQVECLTLSETGLFTLWDRWANIIASQFIQTSRYDPMHQAVSEQKLYDSLPAWIEGLENERSTTFELDTGTANHQVAISQEQLLAACATIYPQIVQLVRDHIPAGEIASLFVSHRFRGFPGLDDSLRLIGNTDLVYLDADSTFAGIAAHEGDIISASGTVSHVTSLPINLQRPARESAAGVPRHATHVLIDYHAVAIHNALRIGGVRDNRIQVNADAPLCTLYLRGNQTLLDNHANSRVQLNGTTAPQQSALHPGDTLSIDGRSMTLISIG